MSRVVACAVVAGCLFALPAAGALVYPVAPHDNTVDTYYGVQVPDPYRPLENLDSPQTRAWEAAEEAITQQYLADIPQRAGIYAALRRMANYPKLGVPFHEGDHYFYTCNSGLQNQDVWYTKDGLYGKPRILIDPNRLSADGTTIVYPTPSRSGRYVALSYSQAGFPWTTIRVRDVETGRDFPDRVQWTKFTLVWKPDGTGFYYDRYAQPKGGLLASSSVASEKIYFHRIGTPQASDMLIYENPSQPNDIYRLRATEDGNYLALDAAIGTSVNDTLFYARIGPGRPRFEHLVGSMDAYYRVIDTIGPVFYIDTTLKALNQRIVAVDIRHPGVMRTVVPETSDNLAGVATADYRMFLEYLHDVHTVVKEYTYGGRFVRNVSLPGLGTAYGFDGHHEDRTVYYEFSGYTTPPTTYAYDIDSGISSVYDRPRIAFDPSQFVTMEVFYHSKDGTRVPLFISYRRGLQLDGQNPTILHGYGGFDIAELPNFDSNTAVWLEMGGIYAEANIRGGSEYGERWHRGGMVLTKQNVFDDFIAAAEYLIVKGYTSRSKIAASGASNGGLLVGAAETERPDLWGAALPEVGVLDMLRYNLWTDGKWWIPDYGCSTCSEAQFRALYAYSPYHNIKPETSYPATLVMTSDHDVHVYAAHSLKFAARLQQAQAGDAPILLRIETNSGHGASSLTKNLQETADEYAFLVKNLHMTLPADPVSPTPHARTRFAAHLAVDKLYQTSRARLALARVRGERYFKVIIASATGRNAAVARAIVAAGGSVSYRADDVGFIEARVPLDRVESISSRSDVTAIAADDSVSVLAPATPSPAPSPSAPPTHAPRTLAEEGPIVHPYLPERDMGLLRLRAQHPGFDGRGTVVALLDTGPDFLLPEMQHAHAADGRVVPKFLDMITGVLPESDDYGSPWIAVSTRVQAVGGTFTAGGVTYKAPHDGDFSFASAHNYSIADIAGVARWPGKPEKARLAILWDRITDTVWVDTTHTDDFSVAKGLTDYRISHDYATFRVAVSDAQARPAMGLVVQTDVTDGKVALLPAFGSHATMTSGSIAANEDDGGRIEGIAPEAQILSIDEGGDFTSVIHSVLIAERDPRVDVVCLEIIGPLSYSWKDGRFVESIIFNRTVRKYGKPIMQPADNDFGMSRVSEPCVPADVTCVGAYESADSYRINSAMVIPGRDHLHWVSSFGPGGNGALEPSFLSPSGWVCLGLGYQAGYESTIKGVFDLPPGYGIGGGTSQATPTAAGAVAVLIGAARASGIHVDPRRILTALEWTARYIPSLPAYEQGNGLLQVDAAYALLKHWNRSPAPRISFAAPVHTVDSRFLPVPNTGVGYFEREGWNAGERGTRVLYVRRSTGFLGSSRYTIELVGNDGTFATQQAVELPLARSVPLRLRVSPKTSGAHSAILRLRDAGGAVAGETLLTVVAGEPFTTSNGYTVDRRLAVPRPGTASIFITVPQNAQAFVVRIATPRSGVWLWPYEPDGMEAANRSNNLLTSFPPIKGRLQVVFRSPRPGTWELVFEDADDMFHHPPGVLKVRHPTVVHVTASIVSTQVTTTGAGRWFTVRRTLSNFPAGLQVTQASALETHYSGAIAPGAERAYPVTVRPGATGISATLVSSAGSSPDIYLFDCTGSQCLLREKSTTLGVVHRLYYDTPKPGRWKIVVDGFTIASTGARYGLTTLVLGTELGKSADPVFTVALPANDPDVYYNEGNGPGSGEQPRRKNLNPWVFGVFQP